MKCPQCKGRSNTGGLCGICILKTADSELTRTLFSIASNLDINDLPNPYDEEIGRKDARQ